MPMVPSRHGHLPINGLSLYHEVYRRARQGENASVAGVHSHDDLTEWSVVRAARQVGLPGLLPRPARGAGGGSAATRTHSDPGIGNERT